MKKLPLVIWDELGLCGGLPASANSTRFRPDFGIFSASEFLGPHSASIFSWRAGWMEPGSLTEIHLATN